MGKVSSKGRESKNDLPLIRPALSFRCRIDDDDDNSDVGRKSTHVKGINFEKMHPTSIPNEMHAKFLLANDQALDDHHHDNNESLALLDCH